MTLSLDTPSMSTTDSVEYTIDEVARKSKTTVRNVRAYQEKGILPPPIKRGRAGMYNDNHLARLRVIGQLLARGYSIANIDELFKARDQGYDLSRLIGLDTALTSAWGEELATYNSLSEVMSYFEPAPTAEEVKIAVDMGIIELTGSDTVYIKHPLLIQIAVQLNKQQNVPLGTLLYVIKVMRVHFEQAAESLSVVAMDVLFKNRDAMPSDSDAGKLMSLIWTLRPMIVKALETEISAAVGSALSRRMTDQVVNSILSPMPKLE